MFACYPYFSVNRGFVFIRVNGVNVFRLSEVFRVKKVGHSALTLTSFHNWSDLSRSDSLARLRWNSSDRRVHKDRSPAQQPDTKFSADIHHVSPLACGRCTSGRIHPPHTDSLQKIQMQRKRRDVREDRHYHRWDQNQAQFVSKRLTANDTSIKNDEV